MQSISDGGMAARNGERRRNRKSRWSDSKSFVPGMPTMLPPDLTKEQTKSYLLKLEIEDITKSLRSGDYLLVRADNRSPSPEPVYDAQGKRTNTRELRKRQELEHHRHDKIQQLLKLDPSYKPPTDYRSPQVRLNEKVYIPQDDHPEINFVGLLIGPRGNTLKALEAETGAKIIIRGKGSVKEGKLSRRDGPMPGENEPLHAFITGSDSEVIKKAVNKIKTIVDEALLMPDGSNELRKTQLKELALLNGTLRSEEMLVKTFCGNCGGEGHKTYECMLAQNVTAAVVCTACGANGHIARDCKNPLPGGVVVDEEYQALMNQLNEANVDPNAYALYAQQGLVSQTTGVATSVAQFQPPGGTLPTTFPGYVPNQNQPVAPGFGFTQHNPQNVVAQPYQQAPIDMSMFYAPPPPPPPSSGGIMGYGDASGGIDSIESMKQAALAYAARQAAANNDETN
uniref:Branchpoint-bridging protein n=1 Tax=Parastrongyloides trichosuri TaxID=131310 RepID=A0A0N4ZS59_PARTI